MDRISVDQSPEDEDAKRLPNLLIMKWWQALRKDMLSSWWLHIDWSPPRFNQDHFQVTATILCLHYECAIQTWFAVVLTDERRCHSLQATFIHNWLKHLIQPISKKTLEYQINIRNWEGQVRQLHRWNASVKRSCWKCYLISEQYSLRKSFVAQTSSGTKQETLQTETTFGDELHVIVFLIKLIAQRGKTKLGKNTTGYLIWDHFARSH